MKQLIFALMMFLSFTVSQVVAQREDRIRLECQILEVSDEFRGNQKDLAAIHYAIIRHQNPGDRSRLSSWLRNQSGASVTFVTADGVSHQGTLRRLRMCFGRGLLVFVGRAKLKDRDILTLELQSK